MSKSYRSIVDKVIKLLRHGLIDGAGDNDKPGDFCVEQAVALAAGERLTDEPKCVPEILSNLGVAMNDCGLFNSNKQRATILKPFAIAQLGSKSIDLDKFTTLLKSAYEKHFHIEFDECNSPNQMFEVLSDSAWLDTRALRKAVKIAVDALRQCGSKGCNYLHLIDYDQPKKKKRKQVARKRRAPDPDLAKLHRLQQSAKVLA